MMSDITTVRDLHLLVDSFYASVRTDGVLGPVFDQRIGGDWAHHVPRIYAFWEAVLLGNAGYSGNPVLTHLTLNKDIPLGDDLFERWLSMWEHTVDGLFAGPKANEAKTKARAMAGLMKIKIRASERPGFLQ